MAILGYIFLTSIFITLQGISDASAVYGNKSISVTVQSDEDEYHGYRLITQGLEKTTFWFVQCDNDTFMQSSLCAFHLHDYSLNGTSTVKKFEFSSEPRFDGYRSIMSSMTTFQIDKDKYLIGWMEKNISSSTQVLHANGRTVQAGTFIKFIVMNFAEFEVSDFQTTGTATGPDGVDDDDLMANLDIRIGKDTLDVFYLYEKDFKFAQERFNYDGRRILGPLDEKRFQIDDDLIKQSLYVNRTSEIESWERFKAGDVCAATVPCGLELDREPMYGLTAARDYVTSCKKNSSRTWQCSQRFSAGTSIFPIEFDYEPIYFMIYSVYSEQLLVMTGKLLESGAVRVFLTMIGLSSRVYKPVEFTEIAEKPSVLQGNFFMNDDYDFCYSLLWNIESHGRSYNFLSKCYPFEVLTRKL
ncbi:hypothetical protein QAD02_000133 [Eretmocerus hayati]|uniref:Uncharacterized protein n=1 Tax=Eretmocerus hayati TaxID=131215 RepID=A0ACC2NCI5_9HYME|nr:hypothetical protein QAD02_000133 [Eretmocerus hayati]